MKGDFLRTIIIKGRMEGKNEKRKTENDIIRLDDDKGLQQVEGESWTSW